MLKHGSGSSEHLENEYFVLSLSEPKSLKFLECLLNEISTEKLKFLLNNKNLCLGKAIYLNNLELTQLMLSKGADPLVKNSDKNSLELLLNRMEPEWFTVLKTVLEQIPVEITKTFLNRKMGKDYLIQAIQKDDFDLFKLLITHGADPLHEYKLASSAFVSLLSKSKPEWLKLCMEIICPSKNGAGIPLKNILKVLRKENIPAENIEVLNEYGANLLREDHRKQVKAILQKMHSLTIENVSFALNSLPPRGHPRSSKRD